MKSLKPFHLSLSPSSPPKKIPPYNQTNLVYCQGQDDYDDELLAYKEDPKIALGPGSRVRRKQFVEASIDQGSVVPILPLFDARASVT